MPRGAQVIYPKDLGPICILADIGPGVRVFESGIGSGALSMTMLRYGAEIVGYEIREDFANRARKNVESFLGSAALDRYDIHIADSYEGIDPAHGPFDRVVLDIPEPWQVVPHAEGVLSAGGLLVAYTPSITQAAQVRESLKGKWIDARTIEVLHRGWHIEGQAVRPDHRMVAHTGFLSVARFLGRNETEVRGRRHRTRCGRSGRGWRRSATPRPSSRSVVLGHGTSGWVLRRSTIPWIQVCTCAATKFGSRSSSRRRRTVVTSSSSNWKHDWPTAESPSPRSSLFENSTRYCPGWSMANWMYASPWARNEMNGSADDRRAVGERFAQVRPAVVAGLAAAA